MCPFNGFRGFWVYVYRDRAVRPLVEFQQVKAYKFTENRGYFGGDVTLPTKFVFRCEVWLDNQWSLKIITPGRG